MHRSPREQAIRSLIALSRTASTARTLNLHAVWRLHGELEAYRARPFFENSSLNRAILVKHRLRNHEIQEVGGHRSVATKVVLPIDVTNLSAGARSFFVSGRLYPAALAEVLGSDSGPGNRDRALLELLDDLPSLDPFLMRERLKREGYRPDPCYFALSEADNRKIFEAVRGELLPLISMSFGASEGARDKASKLAQKLLHNVDDVDLSPLRRGLGLSATDFAEGVFCWKGFIYYKWSLSELTPQVKPVALEIERLNATPASAEERIEIDKLRRRVGRALTTAAAAVRDSIHVYEEAYRGLIENDPGRFRDFLITAPGLFQDMGVRLGNLTHIVSFWRYRFPPGRPIRVSGDELVEILSDFASGLGSTEDRLAMLAV